MAAAYRHKVTRAAKAAAARGMVNVKGGLRDYQEKS
jgi:hypothetical protein